LEYGIGKSGGFNYSLTKERSILRISRFVSFPFLIGNRSALSFAVKTNPRITKMKGDKSKRYLESRNLMKSKMGFLYF